MSSKNQGKDHGNDKDGQRVVQLRIARIKVTKKRREHNDNDISELAVSIRDIGLLNPITVAPARTNEDGKKITLWLPV